MHIVDCLNLVRVDLYPVMCDHVAQELLRPDAKGTLESVKSQLMFPQDSKDISEVINMLRLCLAFYHHIVNINFNVFS